VGISGIDGNLVTAEPLDSALGHVGRPVQSDARVLEALIAARLLPVVGCVAGDKTGRMYNVNADQMATACACAFGADRLLFLTDVEGVRGAAGAIEPELEIAQCEELMGAGVATGGMAAKLRAATAALRGGVSEVTIAAGARENVIALLLAGERLGTRVVETRTAAVS
jgi:acetylglutamate kinase